MFVEHPGYDRRLFLVAGSVSDDGLLSPDAKIDNVCDCGGRYVYDPASDSIRCTGHEEAA